MSSRRAHGLDGDPRPVGLAAPGSRRSRSSQAPSVEVGLSEGNEIESAAAGAQPGIPDDGNVEQTAFGPRPGDPAGDQLRQRAQRRLDLGQQHRGRARLGRRHAQLAVQGDEQDRRDALRAGQQQQHLRGHQRGAAGRADRLHDRRRVLPAQLRRRRVDPDHARGEQHRGGHPGGAPGRQRAAAGHADRLHRHGVLRAAVRRQDLRAVRARDQPHGGGDPRRAQRAERGADRRADR